ncbi:hypothetical protein QTA58_01850 [Neorhizobium sp. CSC1952]|uniref:hypothetical protein n=1 Tax=Neorhizobium sp. CSC1952 TaxID=2978974 RepID=UPI0025A547DF|nr:hypothetical protein [Rhizobium sp. CSC1952]WJR67535.1 hypothetical protein QTA58_01850 [Rhizobium sp. CSC1952]
MFERPLLPILGAIIIVICGLGLGYYIAGAPSAPSNPPDSQGSETSLPARQSDQNALPGLQQPNR